MIGIEVRFLSGRFHGNGWHHAHNEGVAEWPPSPWRLLRALVKAAYSEQLSRDDVESLLSKLALLPRYKLPLAVDAHTRHYMPDTSDAAQKRTKVFDAFVAVEGGARDPKPVIVGWPTEISSSERALLTRLCQRIGYLGRAESWAELTTVDIDDGEWDCWPDEYAEHAAATTLLAPWSTARIQEWASAQPTPKRGPDVPRSLWDVLSFDARRYREEGWSFVPGTRLVRYVFRDAPFRRAAVATMGRPRRQRPRVARFAIRSPVLPKYEDALLICERLRETAMSKSREVRGDASFVFSGHRDSGAPSNHGHAMYLATAEGSGVRGGFIDHLIISASDGFEDQDVQALQRIRKLWSRNGTFLELLLLGVGQPSDFGGLRGAASPALAESRIWESVTPFVPTRHPKIVRGQEVDGLEEQVARAAEQLLGVRPISVQPHGDAVKWAGFRRRRSKGGGRRGVDRAIGARLEFDRPIRGPIALGFGAHFGLGLFRAVKDQR